jgi:hypothetical protein
VSPASRSASTRTSDRRAPARHGGVRKFEPDASRRQARSQPGKLDLDNLLQVLLRQRMEDNYFVQAIEKFGPEQERISSGTTSFIRRTTGPRRDDGEPWARKVRPGATWVKTALFRYHRSSTNADHEHAVILTKHFIIQVNSDNGVRSKLLRIRCQFGHRRLTGLSQFLFVSC